MTESKNLTTSQELAAGAGGETSQPEDPARCDYPAAGPHAKPELTNADATPGCGVLPDPGSEDPNMQPSS